MRAALRGIEGLQVALCAEQSLDQGRGRRQLGAQGAGALFAQNVV